MAFDKKPRFYVGVKLTNTNKYIESLPGPGTHDVMGYTQTKLRSPTYSMGALIKKQDDTRHIVPGPGNYVNTAAHFLRRAPSFGFGSSKRPDLGGNSKHATPGPGHYKVPVKIADVPDFAMPNRQVASKYV